MKNIILILLILQATVCFAQFEKGKMAVGANLGGGVSSRPDLFGSIINRGQTISPNISVERFIKRNMSVLLGLDFSYSNQYTTYRRLNAANTLIDVEISLKTQDYIPYIGTRWYGFTNTGKLGFFVSPLIATAYRSYNSRIYQDDPLLPIDKRTKIQDNNIFISLDAKVDIGICYFLKPAFSVELSNSLIRASINKNYQVVNLYPNLTVIKIGGRYYFN